MAKLKRSDRVNAYISAAFPLVFAGIYGIAAMLGLITRQVQDVLNIYVVLSAIAGVATSVIIGKMVKK